MQNAGIAQLGLDWRYLACDVHPDEPGAAIHGAQKINFIGRNLTVPHKLLALNLVDVLDESARVWGDVNTIRFEAQDPTGAWLRLREFEEAPRIVQTRGFNTDADAITRSLHEDLDVKVANSKVLLLGAGGAGRTAALKLAAEGVAELFLVNRTVQKAEEIAREVAERFPKVSTKVGYPSGPVELLLNATSLGLKPGDPSPLDESQFRIGKAAAVYDMIYRPAQTVLLQSARPAGCRTANGLGMLLYQGARALEIWSGREAPIAVMRKALEENVYGH